MESKHAPRLPIKDQQPRSLKEKGKQPAEAQLEGPNFSWLDEAPLVYMPSSLAALSELSTLLLAVKLIFHSSLCLPS